MPEARKTTSLADLIDADNASARQAQAIFVGTVKPGEAGMHRICGDVSGGRPA